MLAIAPATENLLWLFAIAAAIGIFGHFALQPLLLKLTTRTRITADNIFVKRCYRPLQWTRR